MRMKENRRKEAAPMLARFVLALVTTLSLAACEEPPVNRRTDAPPLATVAKVEIGRYLGKWYEIARYDHWFERDCAGVTAEYALRDDGRIAVLNSCRRGGLDGPLDQAEGVARIRDPETNAKLGVAFDPFGAFEGDYWVIGLAEDYSWALIGEPRGRYLWILARAPRIPDALRADLTARLADLGYDTDALIWVEQPPA